MLWEFLKEFVIVARTTDSLDGVDRPIAAHTVVCLEAKEISSYG